MKKRLNKPKIAPKPRQRGKAPKPRLLIKRILHPQLKPKQRGEEPKTMWTIIIILLIGIVIQLDQLNKR